MCKIWQFPLKIPKHGYYVYTCKYVCICVFIDTFKDELTIIIWALCAIWETIHHYHIASKVLNYEIAKFTSVLINGFPVFVVRLGEVQTVVSTLISLLELSQCALVHTFQLWSDSSVMISLFPQLPKLQFFTFYFSFSMPGFCAQIDKLTMYSNCSHPLFRVTFFNTCAHPIRTAWLIC